MSGYWVAAVVVAGAGVVGEIARWMIFVRQPAPVRADLIRLERARRRPREKRAE